MADTNEAQRNYWNQDAGPVWVRNQASLDEQIGVHGEHAIARLAPRPGERILDVGCGCGETAVAIGERVGAEGAVLGVDLSEPMLARARERAAAAGLAHVRFQAADAQDTDLGAGAFDAVFSRFGVMFFGEPEVAFANLRRALRPGGRLAFVCWGPVGENAWVRVPMQAAAPFLPPQAPPDPTAPGPFAFADAERVRRILQAAGFAAIEVDRTEIPMTPAGGDPDSAAALFLDVGPLGRALREMGAGDDVRRRVQDAVRVAFESHVENGRLALGSTVWLVSAANGL